MKDITIITAFFDIGRSKFKAIPRNNETYMNNFKFWARMSNKLIVYTMENCADDILNIRREFGLESKTKIIIIDDIEEIEPDILNKMKEVSSNSYFKDFRFLPNATSNIPEYSYLMLLKSWFMADAVNSELTSETVAWMDFGFNHGGDLYTNPEEFAFEWKYDFSEKIHLFYYIELDKKPIFETVRRLNDSIMGCLIVLPSKLCSELWDLNKQAMITLNNVGLSDDDQLIQLMSYRAKPEMFELTESKWFLPLKTFGGGHLSTRETKELNQIKKIILNFLQRFKRRKMVIRYVLKTYHNLMNR